MSQVSIIEAFVAALTILLGQDLTPEEARCVTQTVRRLAALRLLEPGLDADYEVGKEAC